MTESGNTSDHWKNNDLGGHQYTDEEAAVIHAIAMLLKGRDPHLSTMIDIAKGTAPRPRDYIKLYTKTAGFVYELAKNLSVFPLPPGIPSKSVAEWVDLITGRLAKAQTQVVMDKDGRVEVNHRVFLKRPIKEIEVTLSVGDLAGGAPTSAIENIDPEKAKAILIRLSEQFPGLLNDEDTDCMELVTELTVLLRSSL